MKKKILYTFLNLFLISIVNNTLPDTYSASIDIEMILFDKKFIYLNDNSLSIQITEKNDNHPITITNSSPITKYKKLMKINDNNFILFGFNDGNKFGYNIYKINGNLLSSDVFDITYNSQINYQIKMINETDYIFYFIDNSIFYLYELKLPQSKKGGSKILSLDNDFNLNTIDCDSFDGKYIFCAYSAVKKYRTEFTLKTYYSFELIENTTLGNNLLSNNAAGPSLLKINHNGKKQFLVCQVEIKNDPSIYFQSFIEEENKISKDKIFSIGQGNGKSINFNQFYNKNPIILKRNNYSIYTLILLSAGIDSQDSETIFFISPLDFSMNIPITQDQNVKIMEKKNILINDYYFVALKCKSNSEIDVYIEEFNLQCEEQTLFDLTGKDEDDLSTYLIKEPKFRNPTDEQETYISFSLDKLTYLKIDDSRNMGELLNKIEIYYDKPYEMKLIKNPELRISENYYIYHFGYLSNTYKILSNFCFLKVINCYESCKTCNNDIGGSIEGHQCSQCKNGEYNKFITDKNEEGYYNCYKNTVDQVIGYYPGADNFFYKCHDSCYSCSNGNSCDICKEGYYFKIDKYNEGDICYNKTPDNYFLDKINGLIFHEKEINYIYKKCYNTCSSCFGEGNEKNNKCIDCKIGYKKYNFDSTKCTNDIEKCQNFWEVNVSTNNIECPSHCLGYIVHENLYSHYTNKPQCTQNCQSIFNPFEIGNSKSLLSYICDSQKYCITLEYCKLKNLKNNANECFPPSQCFDMQDYTKVEDSTQEISQEIIKSQDTNEEKNSDNNNEDKIIINIIKKRVKLIKFYEFENINFSYFGQNFIKNQTEKYKIDLKKELNEHKEEYVGGIDFITSTNYEDFTLTIYPLQVEEYVYKNVFELNNLVSVNFTKYFQTINYKVDTNNNIIIGLIEHKNEKTPINTMNYFFFKYNENNNNIEPLNDLNIDSIDIDITYPLSNYENPNIDEKYSTNLLSTIKNLHLIDPNIIFYDSKNKLFNDICYTFSSNNNTDMTIEDRINEYLIIISLCENNCSLLKVFDKDEFHNPRSLCQCKYKNELKSEDSYSFIYEKNEIKKVLNINALKCGKEVFSSKKISKNYMFWIFIILLIILLFIFIKTIFCSKNSIEKIIEIKNPNEVKRINSTNYNLINNFDKNSVANFKKNKSQNVRNESKNSDGNINDYKKKIFQTSPSNLSESNPPKRKIEIIVNSNNDYIKLPTNENQSNLQYKENVNTSIHNNNIEYRMDQEQKNFLNINKNFFVNFWNELKKREICLFLFFNSENDVDLFIKIPTFILAISFDFTINCLFLTDNDIHKRYIYSIRYDEIKDIKYIFNEEFYKCFLCAIINVMIKIIIIKILWVLFIKDLYQFKEKVSSSIENNVIKNENEEYNKKREIFIKKYKNKSLIFILIIIIVMILFGYISICYIGTFPNTGKVIIIRFIISFCLSIIICNFLCLIVTILNFYGKNIDIK